MYSWSGQYHHKMGEIGVVKFRVGQAIKAQYTNGDTQFGLDLLDDKGDIVAHFNPRFDAKCLVLNSCIGGQWGAEEKASGYDFTAEKMYNVELLATETAVSISLDGKHFYDYKHRLPITSVTRARLGTPKGQRLAVKF